MRKLYTLIILMVSVCTLTVAQTVTQQRKALIMMQTATWCPYCSEWAGWTEDVVDSVAAGKAIVIELHNVDDISNEYPIDTEFITNFINLTGSGSTPGWFLNASNIYGSGDSVGIANHIQGTIAYDDTTPASVGIGYTSSYNSQTNTLQVNAKAKFFSAASGDYYLNFYIVRDSINEYQNGIDAFVYKRNSLARAINSVSPGYDWGQHIATGNISNGQEFSYSASFSDPVLSAPSVHLVGILWQQVQELGVPTYEPVNAVDAPGLATGTMDLPVNDVRVDLAPNPVKENTRLQVETEMAMTGATITLLDVTGRLAMNLFKGELPAGSNEIPVDATMLQSGVYFVEVTTNNEHLTRKLVVTK